MAAAKRLTTFRLDDHLMSGLQRVKERHGIAIAEQVNRALEAWLQSMGEVMSAERVTSEMLEHPQGIGEILREGGQTVVAQARYDLAVWQAIHHLQTMSGATSSVEGLKEVTGQIFIAKELNFDLVGESLILRLSDGRKFPFFFQDNHGNIAPRGGIE